MLNKAYVNSFCLSPCVKRGLEGYFQDPGFDQHTMRDSAKRKIFWRETGFDCNPGSGIHKYLGTGCGIFYLSVGNAGDRHD